MRLATTTATLLTLLSPLSLAAPLGVFENQTPLLPNAADPSVPGDNPLTFCTDPKSNILTIDRVDLSPNPPIPGQKLSILGHGTFSQQVDEGAKVLLQVDYGIIRLVNQEADLCDQIKNVDLTCPLKKGEMSFVKEVDIPKEIPPGKYTVTANVLTKDDKEITCLKAIVTFNL
ncbi:Phosphatidylglycerol/phosphatidylinositol transfer protein [Myotisia sp. PD_48]|nr:Phosphatidylglycerol/phosphatidylinositol transfer protein [Myotisia sp. PD_48]